MSLLQTSSQNPRLIGIQPVNLQRRRAPPTRKHPAPLWNRVLSGQRCYLEERTQYFAESIFERQLGRREGLNHVCVNVLRLFRQ